MAKSPPILTPLHQLTPGMLADFFVVLAEKQLHSTREGKPFYTCVFRDLKRKVSSAIWQDSGWFVPCEMDWNIGQFFKIRGTMHLDERYGPKIDIQQIRFVSEADRTDGFREADFNAQSRFDTKAMFTELRELAEREIADVPLRTLTLAILDQYREPLYQLPASPRQFFPFPGGWLEHTLSVTKNCLWLIDRYAAYYSELVPPLNRNLLIAGAVLHEIGRVVEWQTPEIPGITPEQ